MKTGHIQIVLNDQPLEVVSNITAAMLLNQLKRHQPGTALAVNQVIDDGGGLCVVRNGQVQCHLPLPIAGLMSTDTADSLAEQIDALKAAVVALQKRVDDLQAAQKKPEPTKDGKDAAKDAGEGGKK